MYPISIPPVDREAARAARERIDALTKPVGSLGRLEELAERLASIHGGLPPFYERRTILIGAGDHGVAQEAVSAYPSAVTPQMVGAFLGGFAAINAIARAVRADVFVADFGVAADLPAHPSLIDAKLSRGTDNLAHGPAIPLERVETTLERGREVFQTLRARTDPQAIALGEMGIANTTSAAAMICALTGAQPHEVVGRGTGIDDARLRRKVEVVEGAVARARGGDWRSIASQVGGYEIVGLSGVLLAAAQARIPVVLDGFIVSAAALLARAIAPNAIDYCIASHRSRETGHALALRELGLLPFFDLDLRLGEGSGAALAFPLLEAAARMIVEMKTFAQAGVATADAPIEA